jgi:hypothetical protein
LFSQIIEKKNSSKRTKRLFENGIYKHWIHCRENFLIHFSTLVWNEVGFLCEECVTSLKAISIDSIKIWWKINLNEIKSLFVLLTFVYTVFLFIALIENVIHE